MNKTALLALVLAVLLPIIGYVVIDTLTSNNVSMPRRYIYDSVVTRTEKGKLYSDTIWHKLPDYSFTNQLGEKVSLADLKGKVIVADFFFTRCPTICPRLTENMKTLQDGISNAKRVGDKQPDFLHFLSFTVDPERDSVPQLKRWADRFQINPGNWWLLTGEKEKIYDLSIDHLKLGLVDGKGIDTGFFHTDYMVLIDRNQTIRGYYHGLDTASVAKLSRDVILLSLEKDVNRKKFFEGKLGLIAVVFLVTVLALALLIFFLKKNKDGIHHNKE